MRRILGLGAAVAGLLASSAAADDFPGRQFGLWQQTLTLDDGRYVIPPSQMCIDAKTEPRLTLVGAQMDRGHCSEYHMVQQADGRWSFHSVCSLGATASVVTAGTAWGDFRGHYAVDATGTTAGSAKPEQNGTHRIVIDATWLGPCPLGMAGGDVKSGGKTSNVFAKTSK
ncbi:MAG: hypothetical protein P4L57_02530 [Rhizomicrobium sp.]|nr:hypothetical protein [Rhizomicrobium sp.]